MTFPAWVRNYVGLPFAEHGRGPEAFDCWGLVRHVLAREFGKQDLPDYGAHYATTRDIDAVALTFEAGLTHWHRVERAEAGDIVVLNIHGRPWHVGLALDGRWMLHINRGIASCLERFDRLPWVNRIEGFYRHA